MDKWKKTIMHMGAYPAALGKWVLLGGIIGALVAIGNFAGICFVVQKVIDEPVPAAGGGPCHRGAV